MDTDAHEWESDLTEVVIGAAFAVANVLGAGFLEKVYERALIHELALQGVSAKAQVSFPICYKAQYLGEYVPISWSAKSLSSSCSAWSALPMSILAECINYLKALAGC